jgi:DNA-binding NarL/FixJ family response regulator
VLVVSPVRAQREGLVARLVMLGLHPAAACDAPTAVALLHESTYDVAVVGEGGSAREGLSIVAELLRVQTSLGCIVAAEEPDLEMATAVMRCGASDIIGPETKGAKLEESLAVALRRSRKIKAHELRSARRTRKLRSANRELLRSRQELMNQLGTLCSGMSASCRDLTDQMKNVSLAAELNAILRQELDLESLLRTVLEYVLKKIGSTNAAIFLPSTSGDFTLGAYVNYDCPRDSAETLLDHLADIIAPAMESAPADEDIRLMKGLGELRAPGAGGEWLEDSTIAAFACRQEGECLGVVVLFRDRRNPFSPSTIHALRIIRELFGKQLRRVIRTHTRHLPKNQWGGFAGGDDVDLAA